MYGSKKKAKNNKRFFVKFHNLLDFKSGAIYGLEFVGFSSRSFAP